MDWTFGSKAMIVSFKILNTFSRPQGVKILYSELTVRIRVVSLVAVLAHHERIEKDEDHSGCTMAILKPI